MTVGIAVAQVNSLLDTLMGGAYIQLHTGDPGASGTANVSTTTTRVLGSYAAASGGSKALSSAAQWTNWAGSNETITHVSLWTAASAGTFKQSYALTTGKAMTTGDTLSLNSLQTSIAPLAA